MKYLETFLRYNFVPSETELDHYHQTLCTQNSEQFKAYDFRKSRNFNKITYIFRVRVFAHVAQNKLCDNCTN